VGNLGVGHENIKEPIFNDLVCIHSHPEVITVVSLPKVFNEYFNPGDDWGKGLQESPFDPLNREDDVKE
jgi:hypothetical protein